MSGENVYHIVLDTDPNHGEVDSVTFDLTNTSTADDDRDNDDEGRTTLEILPMQDGSQGITYIQVFIPLIIDKNCDSPFNCAIPCRLVMENVCIQTNYLNSSWSMDLDGEQIYFKTSTVLAMTCSPTQSSAEMVSSGQINSCWQQSVR